MVARSGSRGGSGIPRCSRVERALEGSLAGDLGPGVSTFAHAREAAWIGRDTFSIAAELGMPPVTLATQVLRDDPSALFVFRRPATDAWVEHTKATIANEATIVASDGIYRHGHMHPRGYCTFPRFLRLATREWATLDLPTAIHMMTGRAAARYGLTDRGVLRPGAVAELVVFDLEPVAERSTFDEPRLASAGLHYNMLSGQARRT